MNLTLFIKNVFAMPTMSTLPVITLLSIYLNTFYELMGSPLSYIRWAIAIRKFVSLSKKNKLVSLRNTTVSYQRWSNLLITR